MITNLITTERLINYNLTETRWISDLNKVIINVFNQIYYNRYFALAACLSLGFFKFSYTALKAYRQNHNIFLRLPQPNAPVDPSLVPEVQPILKEGRSLEEIKRRNKTPKEELSLVEIELRNITSKEGDPPYIEDDLSNYPEYSNYINYLRYAIINQYRLQVRKEKKFKIAANTIGALACLIGSIYCINKNTRPVV